MNIFPFNFLFLNSRPPKASPPPKGRIRLAFDALTGAIKAINSAGENVPFSGTSSFNFESAEVATTDQMALTSATRLKVCSVTLSPGTWLVSGSFFIGLSSANVSYREATILTALDDPTGIRAYVNIRSQTGQSVGDQGALMTRRMVLTEETEVSLYILAEFSSGSAAAAGSIEAIQLS